VTNGHVIGVNFEEARVLVANLSQEGEFTQVDISNEECAKQIQIIQD